MPFDHSGISYEGLQPRLFLVVFHIDSGSLARLHTPLHLAWDTWKRWLEKKLHWAYPLPVSTSSISGMTVKSYSCVNILYLHLSDGHQM